MIEILNQKLEQERSIYSQEELDWLLEHIGDLSPDIRDRLVYMTWCKAIGEGLLSQEQFAYLVTWCRESRALFKDIGQINNSTLQRSFVALLHALLVWADGDQNSIYYGYMADSDRKYFFDSAVAYLSQEKDDRAFVEGIGWIHAIAHGSDLLLQACEHPLFPSKS